MVTHFSLKLYKNLKHGSVIEYLPSVVKFSGPALQNKVNSIFQSEKVLVRMFFFSHMA